MMAPAVDDLVRAIGERTGCAGLVSADTGRPVRWYGDYGRVQRVARLPMIRRAPDDGHPAIVMLADGAGAPTGFRFLAVQPIGSEPAMRYVLFAGALSAAVRYDGVPMLLRSVAAVLRRELAQPTPPRPDAAGQSPCGVAIADGLSPDAPIRYVSPAFCRITGYTPGEVIGRNARFLQGPDRDQAARWRLRGALERGVPCAAVVRNYRRNGQRFDNRIELTPVRGIDNRITHTVALVMDVTRRERSATVPVDADAAAFVYGLETSPVGKLVIRGETGCACYANPVAGRMFGCRPEDLVGREMGLLPLTDGPVRLPAADGTGNRGATAEMTVKPIDWGRKPAWLVTLFDVMDRRHLVEPPVGSGLSLERYPYPVLQSRADGSLVWVSQATADLLGYSREEMLELSTGDLDAGGLVDQAVWACNWAFVRMQGAVTVETRLRRRDGWTVPAVLDVQHVEYDGEETHVVFIRSAEAS